MYGIATQDYPAPTQAKNGREKTGMPISEKPADFQNAASKTAQPPRVCKFLQPEKGKAKTRSEHNSSKHAMLMFQIILRQYRACRAASPYRPNDNHTC